jgi:hypothetical protein
VTATEEDGEEDVEALENGRTAALSAPKTGAAPQQITRTAHHHCAVRAESIPFSLVDVHFVDVSFVDVSTPPAQTVLPKRDRGFAAPVTEF